MSEIYNQIVLHLNQAVRDASHDIDEQIKDFQSRIYDARAIVDTLIRDPLTAVLNGTPVSEVRANQQSVDEANEDVELYEAILGYLDNERRKAIKGPEAQRRSIHNSYVVIPQVKANLLTARAANIDDSKFVASLSANINGLIRRLDASGIELELIKTLKDELLHVEQTDLAQELG